MSLLFEYARERFSVADASLHAVEAAEMASTDEAIPVRPVAAFAAHYESLAHPDREWTCIPLHEPHSAVPTDEFVAYTEDELRGEVFVVERDGDPEPVPAAEFGSTRLARRLRFWHSDYLPETYPPGYDAPLDDHEPPRNPVAAEALLDGFADYVDSERAATRAANRDRAEGTDPQSLYERDEGAVPSLRCTGQAEDGTYRFRVLLDGLRVHREDGDWGYVVPEEFGVYQGNEALLHAVGDDAASDAFPVRASVERIRGRNLWLSVDWTAIDESGAVGQSLRSDREFGLSVLLNPVPFDRERDAVRRLRDHRLREVLAGDRPVTFGNTAATESSAFDEELNQEQQLAVEYALRADDLFCIHGPPGTGKSRTLLEVIRRAVEAGEDVLVCADSNQAVDNLVAGNSTRDRPDPQSLHAHGQHGTAEFTLDRVNPDRSGHDVVRRCYGDVAGRADVVAATNSGAATHAREFDLLVLDEATQATCTASAIPLSRAGRVVLAGDHRQLPPFSATEDPPESSYGLSLFEHLYAEGGVYEGVGLQLKTQYRMHRDVAYFPNREFYDRSLRNGRTVETLPDRPAVEGFNVGGHVETVDHSKVNETEARLVVHLVEDLCADLPPEDVGVITPYAAQVEAVRRLLADRTATAEAVTVDTIDSFQGGEKAAVVISLVRSNRDGDVGFLGRPEDGPRRLNVALTRAKRYCAVVGDFHTLRYDHDDKCTDLYRTFQRYFETTGRLNDVDPAFIPV